MTVLDPREVTAQQAGALFNITLRHASLKAEVADGLADIHRCATNSISRLNAKTDCKKRCSIVTRLVPSGKWKFLVVDFSDSSGRERPRILVRVLQINYDAKSNAHCAMP